MQVAEKLSTQTYFFPNHENKRQSASQSCVLFAPVFLNESSALTTRSRNKSLMEYGQAPRLRNEDLDKASNIVSPAKQTKPRRFDH